MYKQIVRCGNNKKLSLTPGDNDSEGIMTHDTGASFCPIMSGNEAVSRKRLIEEILPLFRQVNMMQKKK